MFRFSNPTLLFIFHNFMYIIPTFEYLRWSDKININIDFLFFGIRFRMHGLKELKCKEGELPF